MPEPVLIHGKPSTRLLEWLAQEGFEPVSEDARVKLWAMLPGEDPPERLPAGPWLVVGEEILSNAQRQRWQALLDLDEESSLLSPWTPVGLRPALRSLLNPLSPKLLDSQALARLYAQGGRALADRMVVQFLQTAPELLKHAERDWHSDLPDLAVQRLRRLHELAGTVGATDLADLAEAEPPHWEAIERELRAACRVLEQQHRQQRTV